MPKLETKLGYAEQMLWMCECQCCYLRVRWSVDDPEDRMLWIETYQQPSKIKVRLKTIWRALRGREVGHHEIVLDEPVLEAMRAYFNSKSKPTMDESTHILNEASVPIRSIVGSNNPVFEKYMKGSL